MGIIDLIFPKRCVICKKQGSYLCENCFLYLSFDTKSLCLICKKASFDGLTHQRCNRKYSIDGCFSALKYNKAMQKLIYSFKNKPYLLDLKDLLSELFYESIIQNENFMKLLNKGEWIFVPVPLSKTKLRKRGYNQSEVLAKELAKKFNLPTVNDLSRVKNRNVFLVDDVVKTGSTLKQTARFLKQKGALKVIGLSLARG